MKKSINDVSLVVLSDKGSSTFQNGIYQFFCMRNREINILLCYVDVVTNIFPLFISNNLAKVTRDVLLIDSREEIRKKTYNL